MTIQLYCLLAGCILPYLWAGVSVPFRNREFGTLDLAEPRVQGEALTGGGARAWGAQMNAWEALAVFTAANVAAWMAGVAAAGTWATLCLVWVAVRLLHGIFYVAGIAPLRVLCFAVGTLASVWIFVLALAA